MYILDYKVNTKPDQFLFNARDLFLGKKVRRC